MSKRSADAANLDQSTSTPLASTSTSSHIPEWQPAAGETPQEREKRLKREKRAVKLGVSVETLIANPTAVLPIPTPASAPAYSAPSGPVGEWKPAEGESPAEREKRVKREKRAARLGLPVEGLTPDSRAGPSGPPRAPLEPQENHFTAYDPDAERGQGISVHPSRLGVATLAKEEHKKEPKEKTAARKRYLKAKLVRAKGRKAGAPKNQADRSRAGSSVPAGSAIDGEGDEGEASGDEGENDGDEAPATDGQSKGDLSPEELAAKQAIIAEKKAQRKAQRDAKKAEIRALKAAGAPVPAPAKRVIAPRAAPAVVAPVTKVKVLPEPVAEPTEEELKAKAEAEKEAEELAARKEAKRLKRATRRLSPQPEDQVEGKGEGQEEEVAEEDTKMKDAAGDGEVEEKELSALLRLPGATRPAPPSAATLSALKVHASVRDKQVVDPELRLPLNELGLSARGVDRLAEMGFTQAFAVQTAVLPLLLPPGAPTYLYSPFNPPQDVCVSAPTGSGKTLSYVVPIVEVSDTTQAD